jgi:hypothetical protein
MLPNRILLIAAFVWLGACSSPEPLPPVAQEGDLALSHERVSGCYQLASLHWRPAPPADSSMTPPTLFELSAEPTGYPGARKILVAGWSSDRLLNWRLTDAQELTVVFSGGYVGVRLVLRQRLSDGAFYGRAEPFSDAWGAPGPRPAGSVLLHQVPCRRG